LGAGAARSLRLTLRAALNLRTTGRAALGLTLHLGVTARRAAGAARLGVQCG
jgi:hypothetical protein